MVVNSFASSKKSVYKYNVRRGRSPHLNAENSSNLLNGGHDYAYNIFKSLNSGVESVRHRG